MRLLALCPTPDFPLSPGLRYPVFGEGDVPDSDSDSDESESGSGPARSPPPAPVCRDGVLEWCGALALVVNVGGMLQVQDLGGRGRGLSKDFDPELGIRNGPER